MSVILNADGTHTVVALQGDSLVTGTVQQCTPIADMTRAMSNAGQHGSSDMKLAASIPLVFVEKYLNDNAITMHEFSGSPEHKRRLLGDPALSHFRIWKGKV